MATNTTLETRIQLRQDTEAAWLLVGATDVPLAGEPCVTTTGDHAGGLKIGDGTNVWNDLPYLGASELGDLGNDLAEKVASVKAGDKSITMGGTDTAPTVAVAISAAEGNVLELDTDGLKVIAQTPVEYSLVKQETAEDGYLATYYLSKDDEQVGDKINVPKDYLVKSAAIKVVTAADTPYVGAVVGHKYIDFVVNTIGTDGNETHMYLPVNDLVDVYTSGNGIEIDSATNVVTAKVVAANGLSVDENGIALALATETTAGAITAEQFQKLESAGEGAQENVIESISINGTALEVDENKNVTIPVATAAFAGLVKSSTAANTIAVNADGVMRLNTVYTSTLEIADGDTLTLFGGTSVVS